MPGFSMLSRDLLHSGLLLILFATWITVHLSLAFTLLLQREQRWRALVLLFPVTVWLAPYWGYQRGLRIRPVLWGLSALTYLIALWFALRSA